VVVSPQCGPVVCWSRSAPAASFGFRSLGRGPVDGVAPRRCRGPSRLASAYEEEAEYGELRAAHRCSCVLTHACARQSGGVEHCLRGLGKTHVGHATTMKTAKAIVIGLDGFEPKLVESMLTAGVLPNLARLRAAGGYTRLGTTSPGLTPVAWPTFATGTNPGGHGIFDFIRRHPDTYLPDFSLTRYEQKKPYLPPKVVNLRRGTPVWELLAQAGIPATSLRCPYSDAPAAIHRREFP